jgi:hypothetical protein
MDILPIGVYSTKLDATVVATARTLVQYNASATNIGVVLRAWVSQNLSETSTQEEVEIQRVTTAGTGTAGNLRALATYGAALGTTTVNHTAEGTAGDSLIREGFNILNGWLWVPTPEERIVVPPSGRVVLKFPVAPASATWSAGLVVAELG